MLDRSFNGQSSDLDSSSLDDHSRNQVPSWTYRDLRYSFLDATSSVLRIQIILVKLEFYRLMDQLLIYVLCHWNLLLPQHKQGIHFHHQYDRIQHENYSQYFSLLRLWHHSNWFLSVRRLPLQ